MISKIERYYNNSETDFPRRNVEYFVNTLINVPGNAIELGCGTGRDTIYLIQNGWNVLAIDREDVEERIKNKLTDEELKRFRFLKQSFEDIQELEKTNLVVANFSIPFCKKEKFNELWNKIEESILPNRIFCRKFLWVKRFMER